MASVRAMSTWQIGYQYKDRDREAVLVEGELQATRRDMSILLPGYTQILLNDVLSEGKLGAI